MQLQVYEFISKQTNDPIVERKTCKHFGTDFAIFQSDIDLLKKLSPTIGGKIFDLPLPEYSPEARHLRRMLFRNERTLYKRKCSKTGESIVALYPEEFEGQVYNPDLWRSDKRDAKEYAMDYSPGKFYDNLKSLFKKIPYLNLFATNNENSDYTNGSQQNKNCYMIFASDWNEDCFYDYSIFDCTNVIDSYGCTKCEHSYDCVDCIGCTNTFYSQNIQNGYNINFSYQLINCKNCFLCVGLKDKEYYYKNEFVGKEKRESEILPIITSVYKENLIEKGKAWLNEVKKGTVVQNMNIVNGQNCIGDLISDSKNVLDGYEIREGEDVRNIINTNKCKDIMGGYVVVDNSQKVFEGVSIISNYGTYCIWNSWNNNRDDYYSNFIMNSKNLIGCFGLKGQEYCILNKQYSKEERELKAKEIINELIEQGKRGKFFDPEYSPFPYNDTVANEYFPVNENQLTILEPNKFISKAIIDFGGEEKIHTTWRTKNQEINIPENVAVKNTNNINDLEDDIVLRSIFKCKTSGRPYKILKQELEFYRKHNLPLPEEHYDIRHEKRLKQRPGRNIYLRNCDKTGEQMLSVYPTDAPFKVYSAKAYENEIY